MNNQNNIRAIIETAIIRYNNFHNQFGKYFPLPYILLK